MSARPRPKRLDGRLLDELTRQAMSSPRQRDNHNFHEHPGETVQRLCIALEPDSYVRPHRHPEAEKWELLVSIRGRVVMLLFDEPGSVRERLELRPDGDLRAVEIAPGTWHTLFATETGAAILEVKQGPYRPVAQADFAPWSPPEGGPAAEDFLAWCRGAGPGDRYRGGG